MKEVNLEKEIREKLKDTKIEEILKSIFSKKLNLSEDKVELLIDRQFEKAISTFQQKIESGLSSSVSKELKDISTEDLLKDENVTKG